MKEEPTHLPTQTMEQSMTREIDRMGRVVIPKSMRQQLGIAEGDKLDFELEPDGIFIRKHTPKRCCFCKSSENLVHFRGKFICADCWNAIKK